MINWFFEIILFSLFVTFIVLVKFLSKRYGVENNFPRNQEIMVSCKYLKLDNGLSDEPT